MATLFADRFLVHGSAAPAQDFAPAAIDLATGDRVRLHLASAGTRDEQQAWGDACARAYAEGRLTDFGFVGPNHRFEAHVRTRGVKRRVPAAESLLEWLERPHPASARVLLVAELPPARDLRLRGFVPCDAALVGAVGLSADIRAVLATRSVVLLGSRARPADIALAVLRLRHVNARHVCAIVLRNEPQRAHVPAAAESRAAYDAHASPARHGRESGRIVQQIADAERMMQRGRHAAAHRALRAAAAAAGRRGDWLRAGNAAQALGRLQLTRGRARDA